MASDVPQPDSSDREPPQPEKEPNIVPGWQRILALPLATGLGSGFLPISGTAGTLAIFVPHLLFFPTLLSNPPALAGLAVILALCVAGTWASSVAERHYGRKDDGRVVVDEWAGYLITVLYLPATWQWLLAGFFMFRLLDILKPPPANRLQKLHGGLGIMVDDLIAGVYGCLILHTARVILG